MISERQSTEDLKLCDKILMSQLAKFPSGVWMLFFKGRYELVTGHLNAAESWYIKSLKSQDAWPQFHFLTFWELLWLNAMQRNWVNAEYYAIQLLEKSKWSRSIYSYQLAAIKLTSSERSTDANLEIDKLMIEAISFKQKIAGKSLPMEKFMSKRALRYKAQHGQLVLPLIELMYLWNMFKFLNKDYQISDGILQIIDTEFDKFDKCKRNEPSELLYSTSHLYYADNRALCLLLRGSCYKQMGKLALALQ